MAVIQPGHLVAHALDLVDGVADQNHSRTTGKQLGHALLTLFLEKEVADRQNFVRNQNVRFGHRRHGKSQAGHHAGGVVFQRNIQEFFQFAELYNLIEFGVDIFRRIAQHRTIEIDIFPGGQVHIKARAQFDQGGNGAVDGDLARAGFVHAGNDLEQCGFAAAIQADQAVKVTGHDIKADIIQGEELIKADAAVQQRHKIFFQALVLFLGKVEAHRHMVDGDNGFLFCHSAAPLHVQDKFVLILLKT